MNCVWLAALARAISCGMGFCGRGIEHDIFPRRSAARARGAAVDASGADGIHKLTIAAQIVRLNLLPARLWIKRGH